MIILKIEIGFCFIIKKNKTTIMTQSKIFMEILVEKSVANLYENAIHEWELESTEQDLLLERQCVCTQQGLRYLYKLRNKLNNKILFPVGSSCVKRLNNSNLTETVRQLEKWGGRKIRTGKLNGNTYKGLRTLL